MPEGDTVHGIADRIRERVAGRTLRRLGGTAPSTRRHAYRLRGARVDRVEAVGKHLLIDFSGGWTLRVHLGMTGRWRFGPPTGTRGDGPARVVLETDGWALRCYDAPTVSVDRSPKEWAFVANLGPDLSVAAPDIDGSISRARLLDGTTSVSAMLLNQSVAPESGTSTETRSCSRSASILPPPSSRSTTIYWSASCSEPPDTCVRTRAGLAPPPDPGDPA